MDLKEISHKRQQQWKETDLYKVKEDTSKPKFYILDMFPYPSGSALHVGHPKGYIATDALARKKILEGYNVLHPMGFDTFGVGTEQYAIEHKMKPQDVSKQNIDKFVSQLENFGTTYDRSRSVNTADPKYFKWTQRVFLQMYNHYYDTKLGKALPIKDLELRIKNGEDLSYLSSFAKGGEPLAGEDLKKFLNSQRLAYVDYKPINRCPKCMTGLANEDLDDGKCERCGSEVEQKPMKQRVLRITTYAERLLDGLNDLQRDESMKDLERNWIGKSEGTEFRMKLESDSYPTLNPSPLHGEETRLPKVYTVGKNKLPSGDTMILLARELRQKQTVPELLLREILRNKQVNNLKFRRQHPIGNYIADFYCPEKSLVIELDGSIHNTPEQKKHDQERDVIMKQHNLNVIRFTNNDIFERVEEVIQTIIDISNQSPLATEWRGVGGEVTNSLELGVYTTRVDTVFGMSFVAIAPEHPLLTQMKNEKFKIKNIEEIEAYQEQANKKTQLERTELQKDKTGVEIKGVKAINPFNGESVPIFVADYVLANYGTGVVMAVPAHDERDFEFAKKYNLPITQSIAPYFPTRDGKDAIRDDAKTIRRKTVYAIIKHRGKDEYLCLDWKEHLRKSFVIGGCEEGESLVDAAKREITEETGYQDIEFIQDVGLEVHNYFYAGHKGINRYAFGHGLYFELKSNKQIAVDSEEDQKHDKIWIKKEEVENYLNLENNKVLWRQLQHPQAFTEKGILVNSGEFTDLESDEAIKQMQERLEKKGIGGKKINYKIQDRVFSRQRYRGEPFPILRTETQPKLRINFYEQTTRQAILEGTKTIETRALNPEEPDRYFGNVKVGDILELNNKENGKLLYVKVKNTYQWKNLEDLRNNENRTIIEKMYTNKVTFTNIKTLEDLSKGRDFQPGYVDRINTNGLVGREIEIVTPEKNIIALDEKELPLLLPDVENYEPTGTEEGPLANISDWVNVTLPDGTKAKRETNTMPGRAGSSRYWLRYMDVNNDKALVGKDKEAYRGSVDVYVGGAEHITRHMIYGRFWQKFLFDIGAITHEEPFQAYHSVGLIMGEDGRKMSKRRGNVVNPDDIINEFGTDVLRSYEMFMGPFDQSIAWSTNGIKGIKKFLDKIIALEDKISDAEETNETKILLNQSIKKLTEDIDGFRFNTAISQLMILVNHLTECTTITQKTFEDLIVLVSPFAPHLAEELREHLGNEYSVFTKATWPKYDEKCLVADSVTIGVQINGKIRGSICISKEAQESEVMALAKADEKIAARIVSEPKKVIYVKGKILNIVV